MTEPHKQPCEELIALKAEWKLFNNRAVTILLATCVALVGYGIWVGNMETDLEYTKQKLALHDSHITTLTNNESSARAQLAGIEVQLRQIDMTLQEIKEKLK